MGEPRGILQRDGIVPEVSLGANQILEADVPWLQLSKRFGDVLIPIGIVYADIRRSQNMTHSLSLYLSVSTLANGVKHLSSEVRETISRNGNISKKLARTIFTIRHFSTREWLFYVSNRRLTIGGQFLDECICAVPHNHPVWCSCQNFAPMSRILLFECCTSSAVLANSLALFSKESRWTLLLKRSEAHNMSNRREQPWNPRLVCHRGCTEFLPWKHAC